MEKEGRERWRFYKFEILGLKWVLEKGLEAVSGANLTKMRFRSDFLPGNFFFPKYIAIDFVKVVMPPFVIEYNGSS